MRLKLIACDVLYRELCSVVARSVNTVDMEFLPKGLHDLGSAPMLERMQEAIDRVPEGRYDGIVLGYCLCNNGLAGLRSRHTRIILPRAHDCITLFLGSRTRYDEYFYANPGVYFKTSGWIERGEAEGELSQLSVQNKTGMTQSYADMVAKYGEENAKYLWATLCDTLHNYSQITYIEMGIEPDDRFEQTARADAEQRGWRFAQVNGDMRLFRELVDGEWGPDFLVIEPGQAVQTSFDESIVRAE